ncbi:hypothetical protein [Ruficoccus sp. ZRK36]|uniref:hypothetical protein n=1 Tax=Ruficoccus sp. ZRK36 TaxID=2866311 RepID=UPI001C72EA14|nr:hypothetical protein [Ruficoccus sp. ZRK36]QYY35463.1 hypothetical protein K0V07_14340 [Ruficoccus sp. ZRK36]
MSSKAKRPGKKSKKLLRQEALYAKEKKQRRQVALSLLVISLVFIVATVLITLRISKPYGHLHYPVGLIAFDALFSLFASFAVIDWIKY